jgi:hypothetical protein
MEKEDFEQGIDLLDSIAGMLIALAGNNSIYENAVRDTELEKGINRNIFNVDNDEVVETLHQIGIFKYVLESGRDWVEHLEKKTA